MIRNMVVVESPLAGDTKENFRYLTWCCRGLMLRDETYGIGSHLINPWFMDDNEPDERKAGIFNPWVWNPTIPHLFFVDLGMSNGMTLAWSECLKLGIDRVRVSLNDVHQVSYSKWLQGEWAPHT